MSILSCFPQGMTPRPLQVEVLNEIYRRWDDTDVFVVNLPVAAGKSAIAVTVARWAHKAKHRHSMITTPTKLLVDQYERDYPRMAILRAQSDYICDRDITWRDAPATCTQMHNLKSLPGRCKGCKATKAQRRIRVVPYGLANNWTYVSNKLYKSCLIADESHRLIDIMRDLHCMKLWWDDYHFPTGRGVTYGNIYTWLKRSERDQKMERLWRDMNSGAPRFVLNNTWDTYRGELRRVLKATPIDVSDVPNPFWTDKVRKIVLLSATLSTKDIEQLGLAHKRIAYISAPSPIPAAARPVRLDYVCKVTYRNMAEAAERLAAKVRELAERHEGRGLVHITYGLAQSLRPHLKDIDRLLWHDKEDKTEKFEEFTESRDGILMACGLQEGIDLPYDAARWQAIAKVPWPSLGEPAVKHMASEDDKWYAWETARQILQAAGRVCRAPDDFGVTYILDETFDRLYKQNLELFPAWWREAVEEA